MKSQKYHLWEFDPFAFDEVTGRKPLVASVMHLVKVNNLDEELGFDCSKLVRFLLKRPAMPPLFDGAVFEDARPRATLARAPAASCKHPDAATIFRRPLPMGGGRLGF